MVIPLDRTRLFPSGPKQEVPTGEKPEQKWIVDDPFGFRLDESFIEKYIGQQPKWGPIGYVVYKRTYARPLDSIGTRHQFLAKEAGLKSTEEWWLTVTRVVEGTYSIQRWHCLNLGLPWSDAKAQESAQEMFKLIWDFKFTPPGRGLWMMGTEYVARKGGAALNNCAFVTTANIDADFAQPFCFLMDMSMLGVGVGADTKGAGKVTLQNPVMDLTDTHVVEDSREGWVAVARRVLEAYIGKGTLPGTFDYTKVRPEKALIKGFGGVASGPAPLHRMVQMLRTLCDKYVNKVVDSTFIVDVFNIVGVCVVSGNVRRTAELMLGSPTDKGFQQLKDKTRLEFLRREVLRLRDAAAAGTLTDEERATFPAYQKELDAHPLDQYRWASNNSIFAEVGMDYTEPATSTASNGEPGYQWMVNAKAYGRLADGVNNIDSAVVGANPCVEQSLEDRELCNLVETYPGRHASYEEYQRTCKFAYLYGKTVTLVPTHNPHTNAVMMRNRRIGLSQSGIVQSFKIHGRRTHFLWCDQAYQYITKLDKVYSDWLCVPKSIKKTSVKPSGTVSLLMGATPGVHYDEAEYYFRTIRFGKTSEYIEPLRRAGYRIEDDVVDPASYVVYFPCKAEFFDRTVKEVSMWEQLENAAQMQHYWSDNQVSATIKFKPEEAKDIRRALELYETRLKGVSFLPLDGHGYAQAPYQPITQEEYEKASANLKSLVLDGMTNEVVEKFCDGDACSIPRT